MIVHTQHYDVINDFCEAADMRAIIIPKNFQGSDRIIRTGTRDRPHRKDAAILLHMDKSPAGGFQNYRDGLGWQSWRAEPRGYLSISPEHNLLRQRQATERRLRAAVAAKRELEARDRAAWILMQSSVALPYNPYLVAKKIGVHIARQWRDSLLLPVRDALGMLWSLQFIAPDGTKRFLARGRKRGCYCSIGRPADVICIAEGYATGVSIHEATGHAVAVAFDAGNLLPVGEALRSKFPNIELRFCADDDRHTPGNPGLTCAIAAARAVGGTITLPEFGEDWS